MFSEPPADVLELLLTLGHPRAHTPVVNLPEAIRKKETVAYMLACELVELGYWLGEPESDEAEWVPVRYRVGVEPWIEKGRHVSPNHPLWIRNTPKAIAYLGYWRSRVDVLVQKVTDRGEAILIALRESRCFDMASAQTMQHIASKACRQEPNSLYDVTKKLKDMRLIQNPQGSVSRVWLTALGHIVVKHIEGAFETTKDNSS